MTEQDLTSVHYDNTRAHQIGGETDGVSVEVAHDLGFNTLEADSKLVAASQDPDFIRPQDMRLPEPVADSIPDEALEAIERLRARTQGGRTFRVTSQVAGALAAGRFLDDKEK